MKKILLAALLAIGTTTLAIETTRAQVNVNINIGSQPAWGPSGYDYAQYYYIPEYNIYYDVLSNRYVYMNNRRWIHAAMLPHHLRHIDLYRTHKVVLNQHNPYRYNQRHIRDYGHYRGNRNQSVWRDDRRYQDYRGGGYGHRPAMQQPRHRGPERIAHQPQRPAQRHQGHQQRRPERIAQQQRPSQHRQGPARGHQQRPQGGHRGGGHGQHQERGGGRR